MTQKPTVNPAVLEHSQNLSNLIKHKINVANGSIAFATFMEAALYTPGLGYYNAFHLPMSSGGDFLTAPEISPIFSRCLAQQCAQVLTEIADCKIVEYGAGTGVMAADLLIALEELTLLPTGYIIIELSERLKAKQQQTLQEKCPHLLRYITWCNELPSEPSNAIILANEVIDAMPVHRFCYKDDTLYECRVGVENNEFVWRLEKPDQLLYAHLKPIQETCLQDVQIYYSEINLTVGSWLQQISNFLKRGMVLIIDYGYPRTEYYHPQRSEGTLTCYLQHQHHNNPFLFPGLQDISAHVDFSLLAEVAKACNLKISGYTPQASFLLSCGLENFLHAADEITRHHLINQAKILTLPSEMGELIKILGLTRDLKTDLIGFSFIDRQASL